MSTQSLEVSHSTPVDIVATLSLVEDTSYVLQNIGRNNIRLREVSSSPSLGDGGFLIRGRPDHETWAFTVGSSPVYVWATRGETKIVVGEG